MTDAPHISAVKRDIEFVKSLKTVLPTLTSGRIANLTDTKRAKAELLDLANGSNLSGANPSKQPMRTSPSGIVYSVWSADVALGAAKEGTFNDWTADIAHDPVCRKWFVFNR